MDFLVPIIALIPGILIGYYLSIWVWIGLAIFLFLIWIHTDNIGEWFATMAAIVLTIGIFIGVILLPIVYPYDTVEPTNNIETIKIIDGKEYILKSIVNDIDDIKKEDEVEKNIWYLIKNYKPFGDNNETN